MRDFHFDKELAVCEAATPGPWGKSPTFFNRLVSLSGTIGHTEEKCDHRFIGHARTGYPEALRRLKRLRELYVSRYTPAGERQAWRECVTTGELVALHNKQDAEIRELLNL